MERPESRRVHCPPNKKMAEPPWTPPFLLDHQGLRTRVVRTATASKRPSAGLGHTRGVKACAQLSGLMADPPSPLGENRVTSQHVQRRDRPNVYVCHLDHLLQLPWAHRRHRPPTEALRPSADHDSDCGADTKFQLPPPAAAQNRRFRPPEKLIVYEANLLEALKPTAVAMRARSWVGAKASNSFVECSPSFKRFIWLWGFA